MTEAWVLGGFYVVIVLTIAGFDYLLGDADSFQESFTTALWFSMLLLALLGAGRALFTFTP